MKKLLAGLMLVAVSAVAWALPSLQEVEAAVAQNRYTEAESMMREVVAAKPGSARAHYVYAEILAHDKKFAQAAEQAKTARQIDPDLRFVSSPDKFRDFEALLQRQQGAGSGGTVTTGVQPATTAPSRTTAVAPARAEREAGIPGWIWIAGIAVVGFFLWRGFSRSRAAAGAAAVPGAAMAGTGYPGAPGAPGAPGQPGAPYGAPPGGYPAGYPPARGGGMLGTGLAAAGGVMAGMAIDRALHGGRDGANSAAPNDPGSAGAQPGYFDSPGAANELENRPVDFGTGGNDWDSGSVDVGGGDVGGGDGGGWD